jgi:hypothetical protein
LHLEQTGRLYPDAWKLVEKFVLHERGKGVPDWPRWCFLPMAGWYAIVSASIRADQIPPRLIPDVARLAAVGAWRYTQGVYRFHPAVFQSLTGTPITGDIPCDVLLRLPEWSPYIETPGLSFGNNCLHGFFVHLEHDANSGRIELRFLLDTDQALLPIPLHLGKWSLAEAIARMLDEANLQATIHGESLPTPPSDVLPTMSRAMAPMVGLVLYLCAGNAEFRGQRPQRSGPRQTKKGLRLFPAPGPVIRNIGDETGDLIERAGREERKNQGGEGTHASPRPHIRRAHWHGFWTGPRSGPDSARRFELRWLPPILVNPENKPENKEASNWRDATGSATSSPSPSH